MLDKLKLIDDFIIRSNWKSALDELNKLHISENSEIMFRKINVLVNTQKFTEAEAMIDKLADLINGDIELDTRLENCKSYLYWTKREISNLSNSLSISENLLNNANNNHIIIQPLHIANYYQYRGRRDWYRGDLDDADIYYEYAMEFFDRSNSIEGEKGIATVLMLMGLVQRHRGNLDEAISYYERSAVSFQSLNDLHSYAMVINNLGNILRITNRYEKAKSMFEKALNINLQIGNQREACLVTGNLGIVNFNMGNYSSAIKKYRECLKNAKYLNISDLQIPPLNGLGLLYKSQGHLNKAKLYYTRVLELARESGNQNVLVRIIPNIASIYVLQGSFIRAQELFNEVVSIYAQYKNPELLFVPNQYLSFIHKEQGDLQQAIDLEIQNLEISKKIKQLNRTVSTLFNLISISLMHHKLQQAKHWMTKLQEISSDNRIKTYQRISQLLIMKYEMKDKYSATLHYEFERFVNDISVEKSITILCSYNLLEIMLIKLAEEGDPSDLTKIYQIQEELLKIAEDENQYHILFTVELLKSKLYLLEFRLNDARILIESIIHRSDEMGYHMIMNDAKDNLASIISGESIWLKLETTNQLISKRIETLDIIEFIRSKGNSFNTSPDF